MCETKVENDYYANGQLSWQATIKNGKPIGLVRHWHENGVLKRECFYDNEGLEHGIVKTWNKDGRLLSECRFHHGTGLSKLWHDNDQLKSESYYVRGKDCGRSQIWDEDGTLVSVNYYIHGKEVPKEKYIEACEIDTALPRYDDGSEPEEAQISGTYRKRETPISEWDRLKHDEFINRYLQKPNRGEARQWLKGDNDRFIGELTHEDSVDFVEGGYRAGATKIVAVGIEDETTDCLIVYLPPAGPKREQVFKWNSEFAQTAGLDPYDDWGQNELFVFFD